MIHDPLSEVVRNIKGSLGMAFRARPKHLVSSAAKDNVGYEENIESSA